MPFTIKLESKLLGLINKECFFKELEQKSFSVNWPYLAGMIDGDGCVRNVDTILGLVDKEPVEYLSKLFTSSLMIKLDSKKNIFPYFCFLLQLPFINISWIFLFFIILTFSCSVSVMPFSFLNLCLSFFSFFFLNLSFSSSVRGSLFSSLGVSDFFFFNVLKRLKG